MANGSGEGANEMNNNDTPDAAAELLPCPFCGNSDAFVERADYSSCYVMCNDCSAQGPVRCQESDDEETPGERSAIESWNTRTTGQRHEDARDDAGDVAAEIAKILFTSGDGRTANRLIMEFETTIGGTGWSQRAVALKVAELLQASRQPAADPGQRLKDLRWAASDFRDSVDGRGGSAFAEHARARLDDELDIIGGD